MLGVNEHMDPKLFGREIIFGVFQRMWSRYLIVTDGQIDGQTDGQTTYCFITALCASIGSIAGMVSYMGDTRLRIWYQNIVPETCTEWNTALFGTKNLHARDQNCEVWFVGCVSCIINLHNVASNFWRTELVRVFSTTFCYRILRRVSARYQRRPATTTLTADRRVRRTSRDVDEAERIVVVWYIWLECLLVNPLSSSHRPCWQFYARTATL